MYYKITAAVLAAPLTIAAGIENLEVFARSSWGKLSYLLFRSFGF